MESSGRQGDIAALHALQRYRILGPLGTGGVGEVFRARDERLQRDVALKILRGADPDARDRLRREARTLSQLQHPGISTIYDVESDGGVDFIVMELVAGETLASRLSRGRLPEGVARGFGAEIADALAAAHERGVIHRDLKPGNVMIDEHGRLKLLDFGLALYRPSAAASTESTADALSGAIVGTLPYMAPEQLLGRSLDARADLYSLGVVLYEMTTGRRPFAAEPATALINEILNAPVRPPREWEPSLSEECSRLVHALLERDPARRPASAGQVAASLRTGRAPEQAPSGSAPRLPGAAIASIAVLPLTNLTGLPEQEFFVDGMTEALIATLAQVRALRVVSRTSVMRFRGTTLPLPEIARILDVDAVVEGSVARSEDRVRVTAQLIDARTDHHLWARSYERETHDVLVLQSEVARAITDEIRVQITHEERARLGSPRRVDPQAYEEYLRGRFHWNRRNEAAARRAIECFERSIARDPDYAPAHSGIADAYLTMANFHYVPPTEAFPRVEAAVARALELDDSLAEAHVSLGALKSDAHWDWAGAEAAFRRAIQLDPNSAGAHHWYADVLTITGRHEEALAESRRARELDPLSINVSASVGIHLFYARRYGEAAEQQRRTLELDPTFAPAWRALGGAYEEQRRYAEAIESYERAHALLPAELSAKALLGHAFAASGRVEEARRILADLEEASRTRYVSRYSLAAIRTGLGEKDLALDLLDQAMRSRDLGMIWLGVSPRFDPLRGEPRFRAMLKAMGLDRFTETTSGRAPAA